MEATPISVKPPSPPPPPRPHLTAAVPLSAMEPPPSPPPAVAAAPEGPDALPDPGSMNQLALATTPKRQKVEDAADGCKHCACKKSRCLKLYCPCFARGGYCSDKGKKMSETNKKNAAKKQYHHHTGSGGYLKARPLWDKAEQDLVAKGVQPATMNWSNRVRTWFFGVGGTLDPETGECRWTDEQLAIPVKKLQDYITAAQEGMFIPDREKNKPTETLGNPEHPGRTRGTPDFVPSCYISRERKRKGELSEMQKLDARITKLEELAAVGQPFQRHEATSEATPPSQRRSSVASTELVQPDFTAPCYPVDTITEAQHCQLMMKWQNLTLKAAVGSVAPPQPDDTFHYRPIPHGYAIVTVDEIMEGFEELEFDHPTGEGVNQLVYALRSTCLWRKEYIKLQKWTPPPPPSARFNARGRR